MVAPNVKKEEDKSPEKPAKKKKSVGFNLDKNTVLEFDKTKRIQDSAPNDLPAEGDQQPKTLQQENMDDLVSRTIKKKPPPTATDIAALSRSDTVTEALHKSLTTPQTGSQFERDYKSLRGDPSLKLSYLLKTVRTPEVIKRIFKSSLESDILMDIVQVFSAALPAGDSGEMAGDIADFLKATCECWPFEMAVEFLSSKEKGEVGELLGKLEGFPSLKPIVHKLHQKFKV